MYKKPNRIQEMKFNAKGRRQKQKTVDSRTGRINSQEKISKPKKLEEGRAEQDKEEESAKQTITMLEIILMPNDKDQKECNYFFNG